MICPGCERLMVYLSDRIYACAWPKCDEFLIYKKKGGD